MMSFGKEFLSSAIHFQKHSSSGEERKFARGLRKPGEEIVQVVSVKSTSPVDQYRDVVETAKRFK